MRAAEPNELKTHAYPVLAAAISEAELSKWFPVPLHHITDPQEAAEPSKAALIKLDAGDTFVLYYGELSNQLMLRIPSSTDASTFLSSFFREVAAERPHRLAPAGCTDAQSRRCKDGGHAESPYREAKVERSASNLHQRLLTAVTPFQTCSLQEIERSCYFVFLSKEAQAHGVRQ